MQDLIQNLRYAIRQLGKRPGFTAVALITLSLGIGATTAIFSVVNAVLLRPLAYENSDRLTVLLHDGHNPVSPANFLDWQKQNHSFQQMGAAEFWTPSVTGSDGSERIPGLRLTVEMLPMLGVQPILGRAFLPEEQIAGKDHEVVLNFALWQSHFAGSSAVLGQPITLNGEVYTIVGVMPRGFKFAPFWATKAQLWAPLELADRANNREGKSLRIFARLNSGVTVEQAQSEMTAITARLEQQFPGTSSNVAVLPLKEKVVGNVRPALLVLLAGVGFVLLIACANVAHMLLARAAARHKEIAVRAALGAGRSQILRQFLTESLLLSTLGGAGGLLLAFWGIRALIMLGPANLPRVETISIDVPVLLFVMAIAICSGFVFGLAPAIRTSSPNLSEVLKEGERGSSESIGRNRLRSLLIASEFTFALILLVGAGLMIRSFLALRTIDPGFNPHNLLSAVVSVTGTKEAEPGERPLFYQQLLEQIRQIPGVQSASAINHLPLAGDVWGYTFHVEGQPVPPPSQTPTAAYRVVLPGYFKTMNIPILRGRDVSDHDTLAAPGVVVVNEWFARHHWPGQDAIGQRITLDDLKNHPAWLTVVGVAKNVVLREWAGAPEDEMYLPYLQDHEYLEKPAPHLTYLTLVARTTGDPVASAPAIRSFAAALDKNVQLSDVQSMDQVVATETAEPRFYVLLLGAFATVALLLAAVGIYGVMSYSVSRRTQEIGIRMALGAQMSDVVRLVVVQGTALAAIGVATGLVGAFALTRLMSGLLYGIRPDDPTTFIAVALLLGLVAVIASYIPARRAAKTDPMAALRYE